MYLKIYTTDGTFLKRMTCASEGAAHNLLQQIRESGVYIIGASLNTYIWRHFPPSMIGYIDLVKDETE